MAKRRIGVVLCGSGHRDGSEIHEATLTLLAIDRAGAEAVCMAPKGEQRFVKDHATGKETNDKRDMLIESARIARGDIRDIADVKADSIDALIIPGGQGAALNLSSFLIDGASCTVNRELSRLVREMTGAGKPVGAICIAPATLAKALEEAKVSATLTAGTDDSVARQYEEMGQKTERCQATGCVVDRKNKIVTTPAYMNAKSIGEVWQGVEKLVAAILEMI